MGHEFVGTVVAKGSAMHYLNLAIGDAVVATFTI